MEGIALRLAPLEDATPLLASPRDLRQRAARDGYLYLARLIDPGIVLAFRRVILEFAREAGWLAAHTPLDAGIASADVRVGNYQDPLWMEMQGHAQDSNEMWQLGRHPAIHGVLRTLEGIDLVLSTANVCRVFSPGTGLVSSPHQDGHYLRLVERFWTVWIPLGDASRALGGLAVAPGSHHQGLREHSPGEGSVDVAAVTSWHTTDFACGDVVLFHPHTLHLGIPNTSADRLRLSVDFRYGAWTDDAPIDWRSTR